MDTFSCLKSIGFRKSLVNHKAKISEHKILAQESLGNSSEAAYWLNDRKTGKKRLMPGRRFGPMQLANFLSFCSSHICLDERSIANSQILRQFVSISLSQKASLFRFQNVNAYDRAFLGTSKVLPQFKEALTRFSEIEQPIQCI